MKKWVLVWVVFALLLLSLSCSLLNLPAERTANQEEQQPVEEQPVEEQAVTEEESGLPAEVEERFSQWQGKNIGDYHLQVQEVTFWFLHTYDLYVEDGAVVAASISCSPAPVEYHRCTTEDFEPGQFTVDGLFAAARQAARTDESQTRREIVFDAGYGYPVSIFTESLTATDSMHRLSVILFETGSAAQAVPAGSAHFAALTRPQGIVNDLWASPAGNAWLALDTGLFTFEQGYWLLRSSVQVADILGSDDAGRIWFTAAEGMALAYDPAQETWEIFLSEDGWQPPQGGWFLQKPSALPVSMPDGKTWLTLGDNLLRVFDPQQERFEILQDTDLGFEAPKEEEQAFLMDTARLPDGALVVAHCGMMGEIIRGQGLRVWRGGTWQAVEESHGLCMTDLVTAPDGTLWAGGMNQILFLSPGSATWQALELPAWERSQVVTRLAVDASGELAAVILRQGGASYASSIAAHTRQGEWVMDFEMLEMASDLLLGRDGSTWLAYGGGILRRAADGDLAMVDTLEANALTLAQDGAGLIWAAAPFSNAGGVWVYSP